MMHEGVNRASIVSGERVMDIMMRIRESWCDPAMYGPGHGSLDKASEPNGKGSHA